MMTITMTDLEMEHQPVSIQTYRVLHNNLDLMYPAVIHLDPPQVQHTINTAIVNAVNKQLHDQGYPQTPRPKSRLITKSKRMNVAS